MKIIERTFNTETGETVDIERDETIAEKKARESSEKEYAAKQAEAQAKATARATAQGKLAALGLTIDDLHALGL